MMQPSQLKCWGLHKDRRLKLTEIEKVSDKKQVPETSEGIEAYLAYREAELLTLLDTFPESWEKVGQANSEKKLRVRSEACMRAHDRFPVYF